MLPSAGEPDLALSGTGRPCPGAPARRPSRTGQWRGAAADLPRRRAVLERHWRMPIAPGHGAGRVRTPRAFAGSAGLRRLSSGQYEDWRAAFTPAAWGPASPASWWSWRGAIRREHALASSVMPHSPSSPPDPGHGRPRGEPGFRSGAAARGRRVRDLPPCAGISASAPRPGRTPRSRVPRGQLPHNGATYTGAYERAEFCAACHQFGPRGPSLNGKPLENTYEEWRTSPAARRGLACQSCHMPDRRHRWRGIHDPEMVKSGCG